MYDALRDAPLASDVELWNRVDAADGGLEPDMAEPESAFGQDLALFQEKQLTARQYVRCAAARPPPASLGPDADKVPCLAASYEDRFLRPPRAGERACAHREACIGASTQIQGHDKHLARTLVEFLTPEAAQRDARGGGDRPPGLCVLCTRMAVAALFLKGLPGGDTDDAAYHDQINAYCNPVDAPDGYRADVTLPPPGPAASASRARIVGAVAFVKFAFLAWKQDAAGKWWLDQSRMKYVAPRTVTLQPPLKRRGVAPP